MSPSEDWGTWEDAERRSYLKGLDLTIEERLAWLDEMFALAEAHGVHPKPRDAWGQPIAEPAPAEACADRARGERTKNSRSD